MLKFKSFSRSGELEFISDASIESTLRHSKLVDNNCYEMFYNETTIPGVISFGCKQLKDDYLNKAGYIWSSRVGCVNKDWNVCYIAVRINGRSYGIESDLAARLVKNYLEEAEDRSYIVDVVKLREDDEDVVYSLDIKEL